MCGALAKENRSNLRLLSLSTNVLNGTKYHTCARMSELPNNSTTGLVGVCTGGEYLPGTPGAEWSAEEVEVVRDMVFYIRWLLISCCARMV